MSNENVKVNPRFKDCLFRMLFGTMEMKENIISLYNALNGTDYSCEQEFTITTLEDAVYIKMKNDVSLLIDSYLPLWEQQSSYNPNMPLRGLMYYGNLYDSYIATNNLNIYGSKLIKIPTPQYVVFYNGTKNMDAVRKLKLSDAFAQTDNTNEFEWTATMYNLNQGKNEELLSKCKPLKDYTTFVDCIRENISKKMPINEAVEQAVNYCISNDVMADFLTRHRAEVFSVTITEFNEEVFVKAIREEGREEGRLETIRKMINKNYSDEQILDLFSGEEKKSVKEILISEREKL